MDLRVGDIVESKHHGRGTIVRIDKGMYPIWGSFGGRVFLYHASGRYFVPPSHFADPEPVLTLVERPESVPEPMPEPVGINQEEEPF